MNNKKVYKVIVNWFSSDCGENFTTYISGELDIKEIKYHTPAGDGDRHYIDVCDKDGTVIRAFNINTIYFSEEVNE